MTTLLGGDLASLFSDADVHLPSLSRTLTPRNSLHLKRKLFHASLGLVFAALYQRVSRSLFLKCTSSLSLLLLSLEVLRYRRGFLWLNKLLHLFFSGVLRRGEMRQGRLSGVFYYAGGVALTAFGFSPPAAVLGIVQLAVADPVASLVGRLTADLKWSRVWTSRPSSSSSSSSSTSSTSSPSIPAKKGKGLLGALAGALACLPFNYLMFRSASWGVSSLPSPSSLLLLSLSIGLTAGVADLLVPTPPITLYLGKTWPEMHVDDNFVVPIAAAAVAERLLRGRGVVLSKTLFWAARGK